MNSNMKQSGLPWAELIPSNWEVERGKRVLTLMQREVRKDDEIITCFRDGEVILRRLRREDGFTISDKEIGYQGINVGDIVIHGMDGFAGAIGVSKSQGKGTPVYVVCTTKDNSNNSYVVYYLRTLAQNNVFLALATGIRERSCDLKWNKISVLPFILPPISEQKAIADFLDKKCEEIDELVALQEKIIEELKSYKQSVITETVCKGLNPNAPMKDSGVEWIGEIPEGWNLRYIKDVATFHNGDRGVNYPSGDDLVSDGIPFLTSNNLHQLLLDIEKYTCKYITLDRYNILGGVKIQLDDIIYCLRGSVGNCTLNKQITEGTVASSLMVIRPRYISPEYLNYYLHSHIVSAQTEVYMNGTCAANLSAENVSKFNIHIPPAEEQQEIADYLDKKCSEIDQLISIKQQKIVELKDYKKSLIYEYTTGKKEV